MLLLSVVVILSVGIGVLTYWRRAQRDRAERASALKRAIEEVHTARAELQRRWQYLSEAQRLSHSGTFEWKPGSGEIVWSDEVYRLFGYTRATTPTLERVLDRVHPDDRDRVRALADHAARSGVDLDTEHRVLMPDGAIRYMHTVAHAGRTDGGDVEYVGVATDITERKRAEEERRAQLWFLEGVDRINRAMQGAGDLEPMMREVLDAALSIFGADRAWMVYPCDPESPTWRMVMEGARPAFADASRVGAAFSMDADVAEMHRVVRASTTAVRFGVGANQPVPTGIGEGVGVRSRICLAVHPHLDKPYMVGLDQCVGARNWTEQEQALFEAMGQRLATLLTSLSTSRSLQESNAKLEEAQRVAHVGYFAWNLETNENIWSAETYRIYGLTPQEGPIDIVAISNMIHPDDREYVFRTAEEALRTGGRPEAEHRIIRPTGEVRTVHSLGDVKRNAAGQPSLMFGTVQDVTDRKRAEEVLRQTQLYLAEGQRLAHMGSWASSDAQRYASDELYKIYGLDAQNGLPTEEQLLALMHPHDRAAMADTIRLMREQRRGCDVTKRIVRPDGELRYIRWVGIPNVDHGVFKGFLGTAIDVTDQELLTQELRREQAYLAEAQRRTHTGSWACNMFTRQIFHSSDENARLYGFDPSQGEIPFDRFYATILADDEAAIRPIHENAIRARADWDVEFRIRRVDTGAIRVLRGIGHHTPSGDSGDYMGITIDITDRRHAEDERERLHQLEADLAHINRVNMMGQLAAALAHEIRQPIAASITSANACLQWLAHDPPDLVKARAAAARVERDGHRAADVMKRLLAFYKKGTRPAPAIVDVEDIIREMTVLLRAEAARRSVTIHSELAADLPHILADRVQLQQVFMNLMLNAIEAMDGTGGELTIRARPAGAEQVAIAISDVGLGLPADGIERMFDAFHTTKPQGTGMGLAITRAIVEAHGGRVWATGNDGAGATFHFTVPSAPEAGI
jgi:PAS domain S-box-containing protein